ncbi:MAG: hypothetical protein MUE41_02160 [Gemmatimonadaceae bacterium]|jgi:hypothetical protein|nr:hypothetical protein [Gemmatimonadaceae bacterium]
MPTLAALVVATLAVWRVTHLIVAEDGPGDVIARVRGAAGTTMLGALMDCFSCVSLWVAVPAAIAISQSWPEFVVSWLALSGGAMLAQKATVGVTEGRSATSVPLVLTPTDGLADVSIPTGPDATVRDEFIPPERGWTGRVVARPSIGIVRHVDAVARAAIAASHAAGDHRRSRPGERRETAATFGGFADREVPRPPSVTPLADRVRSADDVFGPRRPTPPRPAFDGTVWQ